MHGACIERVLLHGCAGTRRLLERLRPETLTFFNCTREANGPFVAEAHNILRNLWPQARYVGQKLLARGVDIDPDAVHAAYHHVVQAPLESFLIDIVLILSHPDRFRIDLTNSAMLHKPAAD